MSNLRVELLDELGRSLGVAHKVETRWWLDGEAVRLVLEARWRKRDVGEGAPAGLLVNGRKFDGDVEPIFDKWKKCDSHHVILTWYVTNMAQRLLA